MREKVLEAALHNDQIELAVPNCAQQWGQSAFCKDRLWRTSFIALERRQSADLSCVP
jgi:hypothetical protein